jgi:class 3 adenylate cyclase
MQRMQQEPGSSGEPRYDTQTLRKVAVLAERLQSRHQDTMTAPEMEAIGAEIGLDPAFVRQALATVHEESLPQRPQAAVAPVASVAVAEEDPPVEAWARAAAFALPLWWSTLAFLMIARNNGLNETVAYLLFFYVPALLAAAIGFITAHRKTCLQSSLTIVGTLALAILLAEPQQGHGGLAPLLLYMGVGTPLAAGLSLLGRGMRLKLMPRRVQPELAQPELAAPAAQPPVSRQALVDLLFALQHRLEGQKEHRAFLCVDVANAAEVKRSHPELAVEHAFGQFQRWVEEIVQASGGELRGASVDGLVCVFADDTAALRAARRLQEELGSFNTGRNRLPVPLGIRCGVSAGDVPADRPSAFASFHSPVVDRATALQRHAAPGDILVTGEVAAAALVELGSLARLPEAVQGEPAFSWRAGQPAPAYS